MSHDNDCMVWEYQPAGEDGWRDCTCKVFNPTHDPLCPSVTACNCRHDECCFCDSEVWCMCRLIEKVRADERAKH